MDNEYFSRRKFINQCVKTGSFLIGGMLWLNSCDTQQADKETVKTQSPGSAENCNDLSGVSEGELKKRESLGYVTKTPNPVNYCGNCSLYIPAKEGEKCGGCLLFKGPVEVNGHCVQWAAIPENI